MRRKARVLVVVVAVFATVALAAPSVQGLPDVDTTPLRDAVTVEGITEHLDALQAIADANGGTRVAGTAGYDESADYVAGRLEDAGYTVTRQSFEFPFFQELETPELDQVSPNPTTYVADTDFTTMDFSASGDVTAPLQATNDIVIPPGPEPSTSNSGCEPEDFTGFTAGSIALIQRGTCTFGEKSLNAIAAGASGVIIFNEGQPGREGLLAGTLGSPDGQTVPVVGTTFALGEDLYALLQSGPVTMHMFTSTLSEFRITENIIGESAGGGDRVVVVGAHLDSVPEGPGINDNGSGSAAILEIAEAMAELDITPKNRVRFAFWGAEEEGLHGSQFYVDQLIEAGELDTIALNLNFDMMASPNFVRFVYDGDGNETGTSGPPGSPRIEVVFNNYFASQDLETDPTEFNGRSDYGPFIDVGIPAGGLFSGAEGIKTAEQAAIYGGTEGVAYDECYHQACDTIDNINETSLDQLSDGAAHATLTFAMATLNPRRSR